MKINLPISIMRLIFEASKRQWESDSVKNLITLSNGKSMTKSRMTIDGDYPVYGANGIIGKTDKYLVEHPTITVGRVGSCGEINSTTGQAWISDNAMWVSSIREGIDYAFIYYGLKSLDLSSGAKIAAMPSISQENIYRETLPVPPIEEQRIIAHYLDQYIKGTSPENRINLPESIKAVERTIDSIEAIADRVSRAQSLRVEAEEEADALIESTLNLVIQDLETKYETKFLEDLIIEANYGTSVKCFSEREIGSIPVLRIPNVASEKVTLSNLKYGTLSKSEFNKTVLKQGDILVVRTNGSAELVGRCAVVPELPESTAFASYMIRIRCNQEIISSDFLQLVLRQQRTSGFLFDFARTSAGQYNVSLGRLKMTKIPIPPLDEQRRIVAYLDSVQARLVSLRHLQSETQEELDALLPSVLDKAFKGEL